MTPEREFLLYFHLMPIDEPGNLLLAAGKGTTHDFPTASIPIELFYYLLDTLAWIPTHFGNISRFPSERAAIGAVGAAKAKIVFQSWRNLFSLPDGDIPLTFPDGTLAFCKEKIVACMRALEGFTNEIKGGEKIIYVSDTPDFRGYMVNGRYGRTPARAQT